MNMPEMIEAERVVLARPFPHTFELANEIFCKVDMSRGNLEKWLPWVENTTSAENEFEYLTSHCCSNWQNKTGFVYIIREKDSKKFLGVIDLMHVDSTNKSAEIGFWLADDAVGCGYMRDAVKVLERKAFEIGINRIEIRNDPMNTRSVNVAKKSGYKLEGVMRQLSWNNYFKELRDINIFAKIKSDV